MYLSDVNKVTVIGSDAHVSFSIPVVSHSMAKRLTLQVRISTMSDKNLSLTLMNDQLGSETATQVTWIDSREKVLERAYQDGCSGAFLKAMAEFGSSRKPSDLGVQLSTSFQFPSQQSHPRLNSIQVRTFFSAR